MKEDKIKQLDNLPQVLRSHGEFCLWNYEEKDGRKTKVPYNPNHTTYHASVNKPETFAPFDKTVRAARDFSGIGIRVSESLTGIDIDHCYNEDGSLSDLAQDIISTMDAYTELSPSGKGLHIYFTAHNVNFTREKYYIKHGDLEVYIDGQTNRYLTVTGNVVRLRDIADRSRELQMVLDKHMTRPSESVSERPEPHTVSLTLSEQEVLEVALKDAIFSQLYNGQWQGRYPSQSEADSALCCKLAFYTQKDANMIDTIFRSSGLMREKWNREDYRNITIRRAIDKTTDVYTPSKKITATPENIPDPTDKDAPPVKKSMKPETTPNEAQIKTPPEPEPTPEACLDEFLTEIRSHRFEPISTGITQLDKALQGGFERRSLVTLAAAPGAGKTAIAQYIFEEMAKRGHPVVYVNLEMDRSQLLSRSLSRYSRELKSKNAIPFEVSATDIRRGYQWTPEQDAVIKYVSNRYKDNIAPRCRYITTNPENKGYIDNTLSAILGKLKKVVTELRESDKDLSPMVCIDYLQFIDYDLWKYRDEIRKPDNAECIKETLRALKQFALEYNSVVMVITANNRASNSEGKAAQDSGRDSSNIEYSADVMLSLVFTAVEESWLHNSGKTDKNGNDTPKVIDNDFIYRVIDYARQYKEEYPLIAKLLTLKVVKGRSIQSRGCAKFIYEGKYFSFEADNGVMNPYWTSGQSEPE